MNTKQFDVAVVGAGIVGLAVAYTAAKQGLKVAVFERGSSAQGASVRNFGLIWPVGQPPGPRLERALRGRAVWLELANAVGLDLRANGSLHLAYHADEQAVLEEFVDGSVGAGYECRMITPAEAKAMSPAVRTHGLRAAMWSATECTVSPRQALPRLASFLKEQYDVEFFWGTAITHVDTRHLADFYNVWQAERIYVCGGQDFETLYPRQLRESGLLRCKLQMMRTEEQPDGWQLGPSLCAGLTLRHYDNFRGCPSLPRVAERYNLENADYERWGIHVLLSQNGAGQLIIGDSHEYGQEVSPFDSDTINRLIMQYLNTFAQAPDLRVAETWHGVYAKLPGRSELVLEADPGVWIVNGLGGAGMTLSFGLAQELHNGTFAMHTKNPVTSF